MVGLLSVGAQIKGKYQVVPGIGGGNSVVQVDDKAAGLAFRIDTHVHLGNTGLLLQQQGLDVERMRLNPPGAACKRRTGPGKTLAATPLQKLCS